MAIFVDTSGVVAVLNRGDDNHRPAAEVWVRLMSGSEPVVTTNYVLVETTAVLARRLGMAAVDSFLDRVAPIFEVDWIDETTHAAAVSVLRAANQRDLSLVDCVSFGTMRRRAIDTAFAFDDHFLRQGFRCIPSL